MRLLRNPKVTTQQMLGLARALYALDRLPAVTPGVFVEFGVVLRVEVDFYERVYIKFRITSDVFKISRGGEMNIGAGMDHYSEPGWYFDVYGNREADIPQLWRIEDEVYDTLGFDAEIYVYDESDAPN